MATTLIVNGSGSRFRVTSKSGRKTNCIMVTSHGAKRVEFDNKTAVKFAA